jgi:uncharacterized membrane protein YhaH (DUF805 family)
MSWYLTVLKNYAVFNGRARRKEYWMFSLFNVLFALVALVLDRIFGTIIVGTFAYYGLFYILYILAVFMPGLGVSVRRLHDVGKSGWFLLINLIPIVGVIWFLVLLCMDGDPFPNQYGANPKATEGNNPAYTVSGNYDAAEQIKKLAELKDAGILTEEEFSVKKQDLLMKM